MAQMLPHRRTALAHPPIAGATDTLVGVGIFAAVAAATGWFLLHLIGTWRGVLLVPGVILLAAILVVATPHRYRLAALAAAVLAVPAALSLLT